MCCVLLRHSNMAELVLWKEEGADEEVCCGRDAWCEWEKRNRGRGDIRHISFVDLCNSGEDQVASKLSVAETSFP